MSDLAYSCEYFTGEKTCNAATENEKAQINRQTKCENEEKTSCCYLCQLRSKCAISCRYLGSLDVAYVPVGPEKAPVESALDQPKEPQHTESVSDQSKYCSACRVEMSEAKTELRVDSWIGQKPIMPSVDMLPVVIFLCPKCGKIEFKAYKIS